MANVLTKDFICAYCKEPMKSGEAFKWHEGYRSAVGPKVGGSYTLAKIPTFKPRHTFDCLGLKVAREARANAISAIERQNNEARYAVECIRSVVAHPLATA